MWVTWFMTWIDMTVLVHLCCYWSACRATTLLGDGYLHGFAQLHLRMEKCKESSMVFGSLDDALARCSLLACWKAWEAHLFMKGGSSSVHLSMRKSYIFSSPSIYKHIFAWLSIREHISLHASFIHLLVNLSLYIFSFHSSLLLSHHVC